MNNLQKRKLRTRLMAVIVSIVACVAVMAVGVYAATDNFSVNVSNEVDVSISLVAGKLSARRGGDVIYGTVSKGDQASVAPESAVIDYIDIYDNYSSDYDEVNDGYDYVYDRTKGKFNYEEIQRPVNFYLSAKEADGVTNKKYLTIYYVFMFEFLEGSASDVSITVRNQSTQLLPTDSRSEYVSMSFKYKQGARGLAEPDWTSDGTSLEIESFESPNTYKENTILVDSDKLATHVVYIYASMTVERTDSLGSAYSLGMGSDPFYWAFGVRLEPVSF